MDELDLLKQDWKKQEAGLPRLSYQEIYKMLWKKSSSIVKWIFFISVLELLFWGVLNIVLSDAAFWKKMELMQLKEFTIVAYVITYMITFYFIYRFYHNYQKISATDDAATLMRNILVTRRTVNYYIAFILLSTAVSSLIYAWFTIEYHVTSTPVEDVTKYSFTTGRWVLFLGVMGLGILLFLGLIWLFYRLLYGILLKGLHRNYKELQKLDL